MFYCRFITQYTLIHNYKVMSTLYSSLLLLSPLSAAFLSQLLSAPKHRALEYDVFLYTANAFSLLLLFLSEDINGECSVTYNTYRYTLSIYTLWRSVELYITTLTIEAYATITSACSACYLLPSSYILLYTTRAKPSTISATYMSVNWSHGKVSMFFIRCIFFYQRLMCCCTFAIE